MDIPDRFLDITFWVIVLCSIFLLVLICYLIGSVRAGKSVVKSFPVTDKDIAVTADHIYYLPAASIELVATVMVSVSIDDEGQVKPVRLQALTVSANSIIEPDTTQLYGARYIPSWYFNDEIKIQTSELGLLSNSSFVTEDALKNIIANFSEIPQNIRLDAIKSIAPTPEDPNLKIELREYSKTFRIIAEELKKSKIDRSWLIYFQGKGIARSIDAGFSINLEATPVHHLKREMNVSGLLTRPNKKIKLIINPNEKRIEGDKPFVELLIPDQQVLINVPVERSSFVKKTHEPIFVNGLLSTNLIVKPSEFEGFSLIPVNILKSVFSIPGQLLNFRINHTNKLVELEKATVSLAEIKAIAAKQNEAITNLNKQAASAKHTIDQIKQVSESIVREQKENKPKLVQEIPDEIFFRAIETHEATWKQKYQVESVELGFKKQEGIEEPVKALVFKPVQKKQIEDSSPVYIPSIIEVEDRETGKMYQIPTDVQPAGGTIEAGFTTNDNETCDSNRPRLPGCSISRLNDNATGTLGLKVYRNGKSYILSCYHVLCAHELEKQVFLLNDARAAIIDPEVISPGIKDGGQLRNKIAMVTEGKFDRFMDGAIAEISDNLDVEERICRIDQVPAGKLEIGSRHLNLTVYMSGRTSRLQSAKIKSPYTSTEIKYSIGKITLSGLIATSPLAKEGDSGAAVFDEDCNIIGMVVAKSPNNTYILPISRLLNSFKITLKP